MRRRLPSRRYSVCIVAILLIVGFLWAMDLRERVYTVQSLKSCLDRQSAPSESEGDRLSYFETKETTLNDGTLRFDQSMRHKKAQTLFLVLSKDEESWSSDFYSPKRTIDSFLRLVARTKLDLTEVSFAIMTASMDEYNKAKQAIHKLPLARFTIMFRPDTGASFAYDDRHKDEVQYERRAAIASLRNILMIRALQDERHIVWVDADVAKFSPEIVQTMIRHSETNSSAGIITARCSQRSGSNYDKNAWAVDRKKIEIMGPVPDDKRQSSAENLVKTRVEVDELLKGSVEDDLIPLDSVGATILYLRADLVAQGITFPVFNIVGTTWNQDGWVGLETEGICYMGKFVKGGGCFVLGGNHHVRHADNSFG